MTEPLRQWQLKGSDPFCGLIAADCRITKTDYFNDTAWELRLGEADGTALALTTRFGGRVGLASIAPIFTIDDRVLVSPADYVQPPVLDAFAPGYCRVRARLLPGLMMACEAFVAGSECLTGRFSLRNSGSQPVTVTLDLVVFAASDAGELPVKPVLPAAGLPALVFKAGELQPAVVLAGASTQAAHKLRVSMTIAPGKAAQARWAWAALKSASASRAAASESLEADFARIVQRVRASASAIPQIETGDDRLDALIASSFQQLIQAFIGPTAHLPHASIVASRQPGAGAAAARSWGGQSPTLTYPAALAAAHVSPQLAHGLVQNYLAAQASDGSIDARPGLAGQRQNVLCMPVLARLAWGVFQITDDEPFLRAVYPGLMRFFARWLKPDLDADGDGLPEWQSEAQMGFPFLPTFALGLPYGQNADIRLVESPDLLAYLISEAVSLREMAYYLRDSENEARLDKTIQRLTELLEALWSEKDGRYVYRDRDTHDTGPAQTVLEDGRGNERIPVALTLDRPNRVQITVLGGQDHLPQFTLRVTGADRDGQMLAEEAPARAFVWSHSRGVMTTSGVFSRIDTIETTGLSSVYRVRARTIDTTGDELPGVLPMWTPGLDAGRFHALHEHLNQRFLKPNGVIMAPLPDSDAGEHQRGAAAVWSFWNTLIIESLIEQDEHEAASDLVLRILKAQTEILSQTHHCFEALHAEQPLGQGERDHLAGIAPLYALMRVLGVRISSPTVAWAGGPFVWPAPITVRQHGVTVRRSQEGTEVEFPSGGTRHFPPGAPFIQIRDPLAQPKT